MLAILKINDIILNIGGVEMENSKERKPNIELSIDFDVKEMFDIALGIKKQSAKEVIQRMMCNYISNVFDEVSKRCQGEIEPSNTIKQDEVDGLKVRILCGSAKIELRIDEYVKEMFYTALKIKKEWDIQVIERMMGNYVANTFDEVSKRYQDEGDTNGIIKRDEENKYFLKAINKIQKWSLNKEQVPYKIIRAFLKLQSEQDKVYYEDLVSLCTDNNHEDTYVEQFVSNFNQLKYDTARSYGKVFVVDKETNIVQIWDEIKKSILEYQDRFYVSLKD